MIKPELRVETLELQSSADETFDDLIERRQYARGPLVALNELRNQTPDNGAVSVSINGCLPTSDTERRNLERLFLKAGFVAAVYDDGEVPTVHAVKRPPYVVEHEYGMSLQEMTSDFDIIRCHQFAEKMYYYKDFFYDYDVARQFDPNADVFAVVNDRGDILALGRSAIRLPGYNIPFMHARTLDGAGYEVPPDRVFICEVMGLYMEGREGVVAFKKLMESLTQYAYYIAQVDSVWTTYDEDDLYTGTYYRRKLLMEAVGAKLVYRDFGGLWNLIYTDKVAELKDVNEKMFSR